MSIIPTILYDDRRPELFSVLVSEMIRQRIANYRWVSPILEGSVVHSINVSQKEIVRMAMRRGEKECCIFEHDVWFPSDDGWEYFLKNKPEKYSVYIGGSYLKDNQVDYKPPVTKVNEWVGNHCIIIHESYYETFLATDEEKHIDSEQKGKGDFYLCYPMAALQRPSRSANNGNDFVNYNDLLEDKDVYGSKIHNI